MPAATADKSAPKKSPAKSQPAKTSAKTSAKKPAEKPSWKELPDAELAAYLLERQTIPDRSWEDRSGGKSRDKGESRRDFIVRALGEPA